MIPILYGANEQNFTSNGLGRLADAISCIVEEERNGIYELTMEYPVGGRHFGHLLLSNIIYCRASENPKKQAFRIYDVSDAIDGITTIKAQHISYQLTAIPVAPFTAENPADTVSALNDYAVTNVPFTIDTDVTTGTFALTEPMSIRAAIGGDSGILTEWGAEVEWDMYDVHILTARGQNRGKVVSYGKNITDITQEQNIEETITGIYPYYASEDDYVDLPEKVILSPAAALYPYPRIQPLDLSSNFNDTPTEEELRTKAQEYMAKAVLGIPRLSIDVSYVDDTDHATPVYLCDTVTIKFAPLGIATQAKVSRVVWDVLMDRYEIVTIGVEFDSVADVIVSSEKSAEMAARKNTTKQVKAATDKVTRETNDKIADVKYDYVRPHTINTAVIADTNTGDYLTFYFNLATGQDTLELHINAMMAFSSITSPCGTVSIILQLDQTVVDSWDMSYCDSVDGINTLLQYNRLLEEVGSGDHTLIVKLKASGLDINPVADYNDTWIFAKKITPVTPPDPKAELIENIAERVHRAFLSRLIGDYTADLYVHYPPQKTLVRNDMNDVYWCATSASYQKGISAVGTGEIALDACRFKKQGYQVQVYDAQQGATVNVSPVRWATYGTTFRMRGQYIIANKGVTPALSDFTKNNGFLDGGLITDDTVKDGLFVVEDTGDPDVYRYYPAQTYDTNIPHFDSVEKANQFSALINAAYNSGDTDDLKEFLNANMIYMHYEEQ